MERAWFVLGLTIIVFGAGAATGWWVLIRIGYALLTAIILAFAWGRLALFGVRLDRRPMTVRSAVGESLEERFVLRNRSLLPKLWLEVHDYSTLPGHQASRVVSIGGHRSKSWRVETTCRIRGEYLLGPATLVTGDPFGLFTFTRVIAQPVPVIIYPRVERLPGLELPFGEVTRESALTRRSFHATPRISGLRDYSPGDPFNRIHWPTTARLVRLMVKEFEQDPSANVWVVLDADRTVQFGFGEETTLELMVPLAASIASRYLERDLAVGLAAAADTSYILHPDRGHRQHIRMLEWLARLDAVTSIPLAEVLAAEARWFNRNTTLFVLSPSVDETWVAMLRELTDRGIRSKAVVIDASTFGSPESPLQLVGSLAAARIPTAVVHHGDVLPHVVSFPGVLGSRP